MSDVKTAATTARTGLDVSRDGVSLSLSVHSRIIAAVFVVLLVAGLITLIVLVSIDGKCGRNLKNGKGGCGRCSEDAHCGQYALCGGTGADARCTECAQDADCAGDTVCSDGRCALACTSADDCDGTDVCDGGACSSAPADLEAAGTLEACRERGGAWNARTGACTACDPAKYSGPGYCDARQGVVDCLWSAHCRGGLV